MTMYRVIARLVLSDGTVCGYRLYCFDNGQEQNVDKATAWQYAKAALIQNVKPTGNMVTGNLGLSGTNGFELKSLPSIKMGEAQKVEESKQSKLGKKLANGQVPSYEFDAAFVRSIIHGECDINTKMEKNGDNYNEALKEAQRAAFKKQLLRGEIQPVTYGRNSALLDVTTILVNGYNLAGAVVVGYEVVNSSSDRFITSRLSKQGPSQDEIITLNPGGKAYMNRAEITSLASDVRIRFRFNNAIVFNSKCSHKLLENPKSYDGQYEYLNSHFVTWDNKKTPSIPKVEVKDLFDAATVEKYYSPLGGIKGTDRRYNVADSEAMLVAGDVSDSEIVRNSNQYDRYAALNKWLLGGLKLGVLGGVNADAKAKTAFTIYVGAKEITSENLRKFSDSVTVTRIVCNGFTPLGPTVVGYEVHNDAPEPIKTQRFLGGKILDYYINPGESKILNRMEMCFLAMDPRISNQFSNARLCATKIDALRDALKDPGWNWTVFNYFRAHFLLGADGKGVGDRIERVDIKDLDMTPDVRKLFVGDEGYLRNIKDYRGAGFNKNYDSNNTGSNNTGNNGNNSTVVNTKNPDSFMNMFKR